MEALSENVVEDGGLYLIGTCYGRDDDDCI